MRSLKVILLFLTLATLYVHCHEVCIDLTGAKPYANNYCSDYNQYSCCPTSEDTSLQNLVGGLGIADATCRNFIQKTVCSRCEPWGAHLFGVETQTPSKFPLLCYDYCTSFYSACSEVEMDWPAGTNPFNTDEKVLKNAYPTRDSFCNAFAPNPTVPEYCYSGKKFVPPSPPPPPVGSPSLCTEFFAESAGGEMKAIKMADLHDGTDRILLGHQNGLIRVLRKSTGAVMSDLIKLPASVDGEAGLHGIAAHPNFANNGKIYVFYSSKSRKAECLDDDWCNGNKCVGGFCANYLTNVLEEYFVPKGSNIANAAPLRTLLTLSKPTPIHNGGDLTFGPDGYLWFATGDGGSFNDPNDNAQNTNRRTGKMLRIDVNGNNLPGRNYGVPSDNPFPNSKFPEIWAYGLRNPWRISFDRSNPSYIFSGDVGQDAVEEINLLQKGGNYGWPKFEGNDLTPTLNYPKDIGPNVKPIMAFTHNAGGADSAAIGGYVYRGSKDPCHQGQYIWANWNGQIYWGYENPPNSGKFSYNPATYKFNIKCAAGSVCRGIQNVVGFSEDDQGNLYILGIGSVQRVVEPSRCNVQCSAQPSTSTTVIRSSSSNVASSSSSTPTPTSSTGTPPTSTSPGPAAALYYSFDSGTAGNQVPDDSGNGKSAAILSTPTVVAGRVGNGMRFVQTGTTQTLQVTNGNTFAGAFSVSFWMQIAAKIDTRMKVCSSKPNWNDATGWQLEVYPTLNSISFVGSGGSVAAWQNLPLTYNQWIHVTVSVNNNLATLYFNGAAVSSIGIATVAPSTAPLYIASDGKPNAFSGILDEFKIFTKALSAAEVVQVMNAGNSVPSTSAVPSSTVSSTPVTSTSEAATSSSVASSTVASTSATPTSSTATPPTSTSPSNVPTSLYYSFDTAIVAGKISDDSGNGRLGTITSNPAIVAGKYGNGMQFTQTGALQTIQVANGNVFAGTFSVTFWLNFPTRVNALMKLCSAKANWNDEQGWQLEINPITNSINLVGAGNTVASFPGVGLVYGSWFHVGVVVNGVTVTLYLNGASVGTATIRTVTVGASPLYVASNNKGNGFVGILDEFRISSAALTAAQVNTLMNTPYSGTPQTSATPAPSSAASSSSVVTPATSTSAVPSSTSATTPPASSATPAPSSTVEYCPACGAAACCQSAAGPQCYSLDVYTCGKDNRGNNVLCPKGTVACNGGCIDGNLYICTATGPQPK